MHLLLIIFGFFICKISDASNFNSDYPNITICVISENHGAFKDANFAYKYLKRVVGLSKRCTHIYGNLVIRGLDRTANGTDPDLSFLESIEEISGNLVIHDNTVKRIPLVNLKVIRGLSMIKSKYSLQIFHNWRKDMPFLEEIDLRSLRAIMKNDVQLGYNPGLQYLEHHVDWSQIVADQSKQKISIVPFPQSNNKISECHSQCNSWVSPLFNGTQKFCFGPSIKDCQQQTKCKTNKQSTWCNFTKYGEIPCNKNCAGGCYGGTSGECAVCSKYFKKSNCTDTCARHHEVSFGRDYSKGSQDNLIYTVGGLCTSQCPASLLDQNNICIFQCNYDQYYRSGDSCVNCKGDCKRQIGNNLMCNVTEIDAPYSQPGRINKLTSRLLEKLTNCTLIIGQLYIDDNSFSRGGVTVPLLYKHLSKVKEISGEITVYITNTPLHNMTFLPNLEEIRQLATEDSVETILAIHVNSMKFLGLKKLKRVFGAVKIKAEKDQCFLNTIPWDKISNDVSILSSCNKTCDPLCTNGCWGPGNSFCYNCSFLEFNGLCVKQCADVAGFYTNQSTIGSGQVTCQACHNLCKQNCTGPLPTDCNDQCLFAKEGDTCVKSCSVGFYHTKQNVSGLHDICEKCHPSCDGCTGPTNILGKGGCSSCVVVSKTAKNEYRCHKDTCPADHVNKAIQKNIIQDPRIKIMCEPCDPLCKNCSDLGTQLTACNNCIGFINDDHCVPSCPNEVIDYKGKIAIGDHCPRCHRECKNGCTEVNDNTKCIKCANMKLTDNINEKNFSCVTSCPPHRNYAEFRNGESVCLTWAETSSSRHKKNIIYIVIGCLLGLGIIITVFVIYFRWKFNQSKLKAEIKAIYSNYKEPNMKNMKDDHFTRPPNMKRLKMIPLSDLIFDTSAKPLGSGAFGKVFRGYLKVPRPNNKIYSLDVVIKIIHNSTKTSTDEFLEEAKIMASVSHRHCLPLIGVCFSLDKPCLVSTYAEYGSLDKYLHQYGRKISSYSMLVWAEQIADGMAYLNMRSIIHRDLAARNILVNSKNLIQITDFGLARLVDDSDDSIVVKSGRVPIRWLALETLLYATYSSATDVWAYGVTLWEIFTYGKRPYEDLETNEIKAYLQQGNRLCQPEISTLDVYMVMIKCWLDDPQMRPTFIDLISYFAQFALTPKRFLYLPQENISQQVPKGQENRALIAMHQISVDSDLRQICIANNKSDEMSWGTALHNESAYQLISNSYGKESKEDQSILPTRKKTKRNISLDKIRSFSKLDFNKLLSNKLQRDSKSYYQSSSNYDGTKTTCTSFDSISPLVVKPSEYDAQPVNQQIVKVKKDVKQNSDSSDASSKLENSYKTPDRIFVDKQIQEETQCLLATPKSEKDVTKPPNLPPIDIPNIFPRDRSNDKSMEINAANPSQNSPDSGNSHNFDIDDYLVPSHISSAGYYNLTPSPLSNAKQLMNLSDSPLLINNADYADDGYLEPVKTTNR